MYTLANPAPITIQSGVPIFGSSAIPPPPYGAFSVSQHFKTGYVQNSNLNMQYQISASSVLEVGYVGSLSRHLPTTLDINQIPSGAPEVQSSRPYFEPISRLGHNQRSSIGGQRLLQWHDRFAHDR